MGGIAQLVEQLIPDQKVTGSIPVTLIVVIKGIWCNGNILSLGLEDFGSIPDILLSGSSTPPTVALIVLRDGRRDVWNTTRGGSTPSTIYQCYYSSNW